MNSELNGSCHASHLDVPLTAPEPWINQKKRPNSFMIQAMTKFMLCVVVSLLCILLTPLSNASSKFNYQLQPKKIAPDTYIFEGKTEDFSKENGGFIVNTGFIVTTEGVVVIDTGSSRRFAEQQLAAIQKVTDKPVVRVYITHHHPDHFLGNQVYRSVPIYALPATKKAMQAEGEMFSDNMYRMIGDWMRGTRIQVANKEAKAETIELGGHKLEVIAASGHTQGDLVLFDHTTGVLFTGDLVFNNRAATTPHAMSKQWFKSLDRIAQLPYKIIVPGHGSVASDKEPIKQTRAYLQWLLGVLREGAENGLDMNEVALTPIPEQFKGIALADIELRRSVTHLFPKFEQEVLDPINFE